MPLYEFKCGKCGHITEFLERSGKSRKHICERCKSSDLQKLLSGFSIGQTDSSSPVGNCSCPTGTCQPY